MRYKESCGWWFEWIETDNIRTVNAGVDVAFICSNDWLDCQ